MVGMRLLLTTVICSASAFVLLAAAGCSRPDRVGPESRPEKDPAALAMPAHDELPDLTSTERILPIAVGVEGRYVRSRTRLTPRFQPIELTAAEREILGEPEEPDVFTFYRRQRGPEHGVLPTEAKTGIGIDTVPRVAAGTESLRPGVGTSSDVGARRFGISTLAPARIGVDITGGVRVGILPGSSATIGVGEARSRAGRHKSVDN